MIWFSDFFTHFKKERHSGDFIALVLFPCINFIFRRSIYLNLWRSAFFKFVAKKSAQSLTQNLFCFLNLLLLFKIFDFLIYFGIDYFQFILFLSVVSKLWTNLHFQLHQVRGYSFFKNHKHLEIYPTHQPTLLLPSNIQSIQEEFRFRESVRTKIHFFRRMNNFKNILIIFNRGKWKK